MPRTYITSDDEAKRRAALAGAELLKRIAARLDERGGGAP